MIKKIAKKLAKKATTKKTSTTKKTTTTKKKRTTKKKISQEDLQTMIAARAYELYESRGYSHGDDQYDWYQAEQLVSAEMGKK